VFVIAHMIGNLQVFEGPDGINAYAATLKKNPSLLWTARTLLLIAAVLHIGLALRLNWLSRQARPIRYAYEQTVQASFASRHMVTTGLVILAFTIFHIAHYTLGVVTGVTINGTYYNYLELHDPSGRADVYSMMIYGFRDPVISVLYL